MKKTGNQIIEKGQWLSRVSFMQVTSKGMGQIQVVNEDGFTWGIGTGIVEQECYSTKFDTEQDATKTELAEILSGARDAIIVVNFNKQATATTVMDRLSTVIGEAKLTKKHVEAILQGDERTLTGYVVASEPLLGRSTVIDLEIKKEVKGDYDNRLRQVDHRSINWIIYKNVRYNLK